MCVKFARCSRISTTKQPISHCRGSNCTRHGNERNQPSLSIHDKTLEEVAKTVWDFVTRMDTAKLMLTANATALKSKMTHAEVMGLKEALDEVRKELMEVKNDLREARNKLMEVKNDIREVKGVVGPPKFPPPIFGDGSGGKGGDGSGSGGNG